MTYPTLWLTGLPASGKSTLALALSVQLHQRGIPNQVVDGDWLRQSQPSLGFSRADRRANVLRAAGLCRACNANRKVAIAALISPYRDDREAARALVGPNYTVTLQTVPGTITPRNLLLAGSSNVDKVYDGTTNMPVGNSGYDPLTGAVSGDNLLVLGSPLYSGANAGAHSVLRGSITLGGLDAANYNLGWTNGSGTIATLHALLGATDKVYDGTVADSLSLQSDDRVAGDVLGVAGSGSFASKNVGSNIPVAISAASLSGLDAGNYLLDTSGYVLAADITPKQLTIGTASVVSKVYDGTATASIIPGGLLGLVGNETLLTSVTSAQFADPHAGFNKAVAITLALADGSNGGLASNYLVDGLNTPSTGSILRRPVNVTADAQSKLQDSPDPLLSCQVEGPSTGRGLLSGEQLQGLLDRNIGEEPGLYAITQGSVDNANNPDYAVAFYSAGLTIRRAVQPPPAPHVEPPTPPEKPQEPELGPQPLANPNAQVEQGQLVTQLGIWVNLVREPSVNEEGLITVYIPHRMLARDAVLDFPLPRTLALQMAANAELDISTPEGDPLPAWLRYETASMRFVVGTVPTDALPQELLLRYGGKRWTLRITETEVSAAR